MKIPRRTMLAGSGAALAAAAAARSEAAEPEPGLAAFLAADGQSITAVYVLTGEGGRSRLIESQVPADASPYPLFRQFLTYKATSTAIYSAPAGYKIMPKANAARELLFITAGDVTLIAIDSMRRCPAGTVILADAQSRAGLSEQAGPKGYTAIKVELA